MSFLRRRLKCFYCNKPSDQSFAPGLKSFHCQVCDATNHLDENGQITDPPTPKASRQLDNRRYAQDVSRLRSVSPQVETAAPSLFCHTCTSNQQLVRQTLAEYLPDPSDPRYKEFERGYEAYKHDLEARYPQVCANCEPRVRAQLQQSGYMAKSDYMRRMVDKTKRRGPVSSGWKLKHCLGLLGGTLWITVVMAQLAWNISGLIATADDGLKDVDGLKGIQECGRQALKEWQVDFSCVTNIYAYLKLALIINGSSIWWNPVMLRAVNRANGLGEFYRLQALLFVVRLAAWRLLSPNSALEKNATQGAHALLLVLNVALNAVCLHVAQPRIKRPVDFSQELPPLVEPGSLESSSINAPAMPQAYFHASTFATSQKSSFPIARLAAQPAPEPYQPPVPPSDLALDDPDAMDVDEGPSQAASLYRDHFSRNNAISSAFNPVQPPLPLKAGPAYNTRNHGRRPSPEKRGNRNLSDWMSEAATSVADDDETLTVVDDDEDESPVKFDQSFVPANMRNRKHYDFAGPKLNVHKSETGLEDVFKDIFGFGDEPKLAATRRQPPAIAASVKATSAFASTSQQRPAQGTVPGPGRDSPAATAQIGAAEGQLPVPAITLPGLLLCFAATYAFSVGNSVPEKAQTAFLAWVACIGSVRLFDALRPSRKYWELSNVLMYVVEAVLAMYLCIVRVDQMVQLGQLASEPATSTGPQDPVVGTDTEYLDDAAGRARVGAGGAEDGAQLLDIQQAAFILLGWVLVQEVSIVYRRWSLSGKLL